MRQEEDGLLTEAKDLVDKMTRVFQKKDGYGRFERGCDDILAEGWLENPPRTRINLETLRRRGCSIGLPN